jgi:hypothetical protein
MEIQEIEITIDKNGQVVLHVRGAKGMVCTDLTKDLEAALGSEVIDRQLTPESQEKPDTPLGPTIEINRGK